MEIPPPMSSAINIEEHSKRNTKKNDLSQGLSLRLGERSEAKSCKKWANSIENAIYKATSSSSSVPEYEQKITAALETINRTEPEELIKQLNKDPFMKYFIQDRSPRKSAEKKSALSNPFAKTTRASPSSKVMHKKLYATQEPSPNEKAAEDFFNSLSAEPSLPQEVVKKEPVMQAPEEKISLAMDWDWGEPPKLEENKKEEEKKTVEDSIHPSLESIPFEEEVVKPAPFSKEDKKEIIPEGSEIIQEQQNEDAMKPSQQSIEDEFQKSNHVSLNEDITQTHEEKKIELSPILEEQKTNAVQVQEIERREPSPSKPEIESQSAQYEERIILSSPEGKGVIETDSSQREPVIEQTGISDINEIPMPQTNEHSDIVRDSAPREPAIAEYSQEVQSERGGDSEHRESSGLHFSHEEENKVTHAGLAYGSLHQYATESEPINDFQHPSILPASTNPPPKLQKANCLKPEEIKNTIESALKGTLLKYQQSESDMREKMLGLERDLSRIQRINSAIEEQNARYEKQMKDAWKKIDELKLNSALSQIEDIRNKKMQENMDKNKKDMEYYQIEIKKMHEKLKASEEQIAKRSLEYNAQLKKLRQEVQIVPQQSANIVSPEKNDLEVIIENKTKEILNLNEELENTKRKCIQLEEEKEQSHQEMEKIKEEKFSYENSLSDAKIQNEHLLFENEELRKKVESLTNAFHSATHIIEEVHKEEQKETGGQEHTSDEDERDAQFFTNEYQHSMEQNVGGNREHIEEQKAGRGRRDKDVSAESGSTALIENRIQHEHKVVQEIHEEEISEERRPLEESGVPDEEENKYDELPLSPFPPQAESTSLFPELDSHPPLEEQKSVPLPFHPFLDEKDDNFFDQFQTSPPEESHPEPAAKKNQIGVVPDDLF